MSRLVTALLQEVATELIKATAKHGSMNSGHEGWAVIKEEMDELWEHVRADTWRGPEARHEAIQIAAMALRYIIDLSDQTDLDVLNNKKTTKELRMAQLQRKQSIPDAMAVLGREI